MSGQVLERMQSRTEIGHSDTVEILGRLAERQVACGPGMRPGEVAREEPLGGPRAEAAHLRDPRAHVVVVERRQAGEVEVAAREADRVLGLAPREPDLDQLLLARVGDPLAGRKGPRLADRSPSRSTSRLRIATAANSETCWAVIDVTSASNGSGWSGGRKPRRRATIGASTGSSAAQA